MESSVISKLGTAAKQAEKTLCNISTTQKNAALQAIASKLADHKEAIIKANQLDIKNAEENKMSPYLIDRLTLTDARIDGICEGVLQIMRLKDPVGEFIGGNTLPNGLEVIKKRVPIGVIGIIFESRPNVTVDAACLCLKSGNVCILRGGSDAIHSNKCLVNLMRSALEETGITPDAIALVEDTSRETAGQMMKANDYIDVLVPRGGKGLINNVIQNSTVPVIQTGEGNCHLYVDASADVAMAVNICDNAKTQRPSVCNSIETVLVHKDIAKDFFEALHARWNGKVKIYGDKQVEAYIPITEYATDEHYFTEFLDYSIAAKVVGDIDEAIAHISKYGTKHSESIITQDVKNAQDFTARVDAATVYVNASTRFTDGFEFGLGAEIGISTQKLHVRGPMGLEALTTYKYIIRGDGQIRG